MRSVLPRVRAAELVGDIGKREERPSDAPRIAKATGYCLHEVETIGLRCGIGEDRSNAVISTLCLGDQDALGAEVLMCKRHAFQADGAVWADAVATDHQNGVGQAKGREEKEGHDEEAKFAEGERMDTD